MNRLVWRVVFIHTLIYLIVALVFSCGMLKKTTREQQIYKQEIGISAENNQLDLSKLYRETERYSYRPDGSVETYELEREQIAAAKLSQMKQQTQQKTELRELKKTSSPARLWILAGLLILVASGFLLIKANLKR